MKRKILALILTLSSTFSVVNVPAKAAQIDGYACKTISVSGRYSDSTNKNSCKKIIRTYDDLTKIKKHIKNNYNYSKKYIKSLRKYKKSYFKKNALIFVTENVDLNFRSYRLLSITKNSNIVLNVEKKNLLKKGQGATCVVIYGANTYIIEAKKSKIKNVKKVKVTYDFVQNTEE